MHQEDKIQYFQELLKKYREGNCTKEEKALINAWFYQGFDEIDDSMVDSERQSIANELNQRLNNLVPPTNKKTYGLNKYYSIAALLLAVFFIAYFLIRNQNTDNLPAQQLSDLDPTKVDLSPGKRNALLKFEDGTVDENPDSTTLTYLNSTSEMLTMEVPVASTFSFILEDGTKVWLNSSSKISYPKKFSTGSRKVTLYGEAYFDVAKDKNRPFLIETNGTEIRVLGTSFNVNAYNETVSTTLVEGSLKVSNGTHSSTLKPGQEAIANAQKIEIAEPNIQTKTAWQRGEFFFDGNNLHEILERLKRWYNVDIEGLDKLNYKSTFKGSIDMNQNLSSVLKILNLATGKNIELNNNTIKIN